MLPQIDEKYLITTDSWFLGPDGNQYKAVFGTVTAVLTDKEYLGITTNRQSTNWYLVIGEMVIAGCQIHYAVRTDSISSGPSTVCTKDEDKNNAGAVNFSHIYITT